VSGAHRGGVGNPVTAALKSARFILTLGALVIGVPALFGLDIYLQVTGTPPVRLGATAALAAVIVVSAIKSGYFRQWHRPSAEK
jgi:hypothetical protein